MSSGAEVLPCGRVIQAGIEPDVESLRADFVTAMTGLEGDQSVRERELFERENAVAFQTRRRRMAQMQEQFACVR